MRLVELVEDLRAPLLLAARGGDVAQLGQRLREACDRLVRDRLPPERIGPMKKWRAGLDRLERLARDDVQVQVQIGLRLCHALAGPPRREPPAQQPIEVMRAAGPLDAPAQTISGIGPKWARLLADKGLETIEDLAWFVPRRYDDLRKVVPLGEAMAAADTGERVTLCGEVTRVRFHRWRRRWLEVGLADGEVKLVARWFHAHGGMAARFEVGKRVLLSGPIKRRLGVAEMSNPDILGDADDEAAARRTVLRPRYPEVEGVAPAIVRRACRAAADRAAPHLIDGVPEAVARRVELPPLGEALARLHTPLDDLDEDRVAALCRGESEWHRRLAFDELFFLALAVQRRRVERRAQPAPRCAAPPGAMQAVARALPFALTRAQSRAIGVIAKDLGAEQPMNRLLQGDVGAGKTAVAFAAAHACVAAGRQVAIMAPTELLAEQHAGTLGEWARALGHRLAVLTASTPKGVRESTLGLLAAGKIHVVVGTHALLAERVGFSDLGLVVIDEQHRFGVAQRVRLRSKGEGTPHLLVMTATPIPRTLALTIYGDLDVTTLDELPPGRTPPVTKVSSGARGRKHAYGLLRAELGRGARAFVVCPLVAPSEDPEMQGWADAVSTAARLEEELAPHRVGVVHGRLPAAERDAAMSRLRAGELDVLVATTVIEVGVDVPQATVMLVEDADRFGLAQLHQLRGRVGRGGGVSHCLLLTKGARTSQAAQRLAALSATSDGFRIAEEDLAIRGPGELLGVRQAGLPKLRFGDLVRHAELAALARKEAEALLSRDPALARPEHAACAQVLAERATPTAPAGEGG